jgi:hypothetical protein
MKRIVIVALLAASGLAALPASAQVYYGDGDDYRPRREYDYRPRRDREYEYRRDYDEPRRGFYERRASNTCITARGACPTYRPLPHGAPCGCEIPGFGYKRGAVQ